MLKGINYGKTQQINTIDGVKVGYYSFSANTFIPKHFHENNHFCFIFSGIYKESVTSNSSISGPGILNIYPSQRIHVASLIKTPVKCLDIEIPVGWINLKAQKLKHAQVSVLLYRLTNELSFTPQSNLVQESIIQELLQLLTSSKKREKQGPNWINQVLELLHECYAQNISLKDLAKSFDIHPVYLSRAFKQQTGKTLGQYLRTVRLAKVLELLKTKNLSLSEIALDCGFYDQSHLSHVFKERFKTSPSQYRSQFLK